jgi:hypothetical protein
MRFSQLSAPLAGLMLALTALAAQAAPEPAASGAPHEGRKHELAFQKMDADHDGTVSLDEFKAGLKDHPRMLGRAEELFKKLDKNNDGKIDKAEYQAHRGWRHGRGHKEKAEGEKE